MADLPLRIHAEMSHPGSGNTGGASGDEHDDGRGLPNVTNCKLDLQPNYRSASARSLVNLALCSTSLLPEPIREPAAERSEHKSARTNSDGQISTAAGRWMP